MNGSSWTTRVKPDVPSMVLAARPNATASQLSASASRAVTPAAASHWPAWMKGWSCPLLPLLVAGGHVHVESACSGIHLGFTPVSRGSTGRAAPAALNETAARA
jgi:hypothetical protein